MSILRQKKRGIMPVRECRLWMGDVGKTLSASRMPEFCIGSNDWRSLLEAAGYTMDL